MERSYSITCDSDLARRIDSLAREYDLTAQEVLRQLIALGLDEIGSDEIGSDGISSDKIRSDD